MIPMGGNKIALNPRGRRAVPRRLHPDGQHRRERRAPVRRQPRRSGRVRAREPPEGGRGAGRAATSRPRSCRSKTRVFDGEVWRDDHRRQATRARAPTRRWRSWRRSSRRSIRPARVTAGNSSPLTDGAAAVVLMARRQGARPRARSRARYFRAFAVAGVPPEIMGIGPVPAVRKLLAQDRPQDRRDRSLRGQRGVRVAGALLRARARACPPERVNVNGGAIALGHPLGARARGRSRPRCTSSSAARAATPSSRCASAAAWARPV